MLYLGDQVPIEQLAKCVMATYEVTSQTAPFTVQTSQVTTFAPNPDDGVPIIARIVSPPLHALQAALKASFLRHGVTFNNQYPEYRPHTTLGYAQDPLVHADGLAEQAIPLIEWGVGEMVLWGGDSGDDRLVVTFPFALAPSKTAMYRAFVRLATQRRQANLKKPLMVLRNEAEGFEVHIIQYGEKFHVVLFDTDDQEYFPSPRIYPNLERAEVEARKIIRGAGPGHVRMATH